MLRNLVNKLPLRVVLTIPFVILIAATVGVTGYLAFHNGQNAVHNLAAQLQNGVAARVAFHRLAMQAMIPLVDTGYVPGGWIDAERWQIAMGDAYAPERPGYTLEFVQAAQE